MTCSPERVVYLAPSDIQVARVDRQVIVHFCSALAKAGVAVRLVALRIRLSTAENYRPTNPLDLYDAKCEFEVEMTPTWLSQDSSGWAIGLVRLRVHLGTAVKEVLAGGDPRLTVFYAKNYVPVACLVVLRLFRPFRIVFEAHMRPRTAFQRMTLKRVDGVVANSFTLARELEVHREASAILPSHQGVDLDVYDVARSRTEIRADLGLPPDRKIAIYTGKIFEGYDEVEYIVSAAQLPECRDVQFVLVGGRDDSVAAWRREIDRRGVSNVIFTGFVPPRDIHWYHLAADVLVLYYPAGLELNAYRSPGKLFGYMASGVPIVAVDLPVLREVLGEVPAAAFVPANSPRALAAAIGGLLRDPAAGQALGKQARERVRLFTWDARAEKFLEFLRDLGPRPRRIRKACFSLLRRIEGVR